MIITKEDYDYLAHYGTKGMQWGVRKQRRIEKRAGKQQKRIVNPISRVASGTANRRDKAKTALNLSLVDIVRGKGLTGGAQLGLDRAQKIQTDIKEGRRRTLDILQRAGGVNMRYLDYSYKKP